METELKYRIVGASVLVFLGVVFIPMILSPTDKIDQAFPDEVSLLESGDAFHSRVAPTIEQTEVRRGALGTQYKDQSISSAQQTKLPTEKPERNITLGNETKAEREFFQAVISGNHRSSNPGRPEKNEKAVIPATSKVSSRQKPKAWAVQVGSFSKRKNALNFRDLLRKKGYRAFAEFIQGGNIGKARTRVFVGPVLVRGKALQSAEKLRSDMNIDGIVVRYSNGG
uniref:Cell division protein DedD (Protein involved in septation) n=1 Tax=Candidatus Kentrum sp. LPFa TaxID=2126335 RepID=A0A450W4M4_9GAMM|nr:MAG: Cell division protein DedD (protein involved in septation) [Candidatus Kentron sp. LPFa]